MVSSLQLLVASCMAIPVLVFMVTLLLSWWVFPCLAYRKLRACGFSGPKPSFPLGNWNDMTRLKNPNSTTSFSSSSSSNILNDIHSIAFPYFARWQKSHGKVLMYWLGTEPFVYIADPEFLQRMSVDINGRGWGKPNVFKHDRDPMFGSGLLMVEGDDWVRHRRVVTPSFSAANLKAMASLVAESATKTLDRWAGLINSDQSEINVATEMIRTTGEIIAKTIFGMSYENGSKVLEKLMDLQMTLFMSNRHVGVPFGKFLLNRKETLKAKALGKEIDALLHSIIIERSNKPQTGVPEKDLLGLLLADDTVDCRKERALTTKELVDECKTFFFAGHETTALALTWSLLLLAVHPRWQKQLREEIEQVIGDGRIIDAAKLAGLKKMGWVMNEVLRLYPPAPNAQRQARKDIQVGNKVIPNGTNIWIDVVSMHHDEELWGKDANEFRPERWLDDNIYGGCNHKMGFLPFGFGGRMCVGRNLASMEYRVLLTLILSRFSFSPSPNYCHEPSIMLSLRPMHGIPLIFKPL